MPQQARSHAAPRGIPISILIGVLLLDLAGFLPGVTVFASVVAAVVLLALDARGFLTLNGLIDWRRIRGRLRFVMVVAAILFFKFLVIVYIAQRIFGLVAGGVRGVAPVRTSPAASPTRDRPSAVETRVDPEIATIEPDAGTIQRGLVDLLAETRTRLPQDVLERVTAVAAAIIDVLPAYRAAGLDAHDRFVVARTAGDYLPSSLRSYLKVPPGYRSVRLPDADGKTANQVLLDQLDLMIRRMQALADAAYRKDVEDLLVQGRFLRTKFGGQDLSVDS